MRLAFYTYSYTDRLGMPLEPALEKIAAAGYDGIDISGTHGPSADPLSVTSGLRRRTRGPTASRRRGVRRWWVFRRRRKRGQRRRLRAVLDADPLFPDMATPMWDVVGRLGLTVVAGEYSYDLHR